MAGENQWTDLNIAIFAEEVKFVTNVWVLAPNEVLLLWKLWVIDKEWVLITNMGKVIEFVIRLGRVSNFSKSDTLTYLAIKKIFEDIMENNKAEDDELNEQNQASCRGIRWIQFIDWGWEIEFLHEIFETTIK